MSRHLAVAGLFALMLLSYPHTAPGEEAGNHKVIDHGYGAAPYAMAREQKPTVVGHTAKDWLSGYEAAPYAMARERKLAVAGHTARDWLSGYEAAPYAMARER